MPVVVTRADGRSGPTSYSTSQKSQRMHATPRPKLSIPTPVAHRGLVPVRLGWVRTLPGLHFARQWGAHLGSDHIGRDTRASLARGVGGACRRVITLECGEPPPTIPAIPASTSVDAVWLGSRSSISSAALHGQAGGVDAVPSHRAFACSLGKTTAGEAEMTKQGQEADARGRGPNSTLLGLLLGYRPTSFARLTRTTFNAAGFAMRREVDFARESGPGCCSTDDPLSLSRTKTGPLHLERQSAIAQSYLDSSHSTDLDSTQQSSSTPLPPSFRKGDPAAAPTTTPCTSRSARARLDTCHLTTFNPHHPHPPRPPCLASTRANTPRSAQQPLAHGPC